MKINKWSLGMGIGDLVKFPIPISLKYNIKKE
jgi:hypothetical protein